MTHVATFLTIASQLRVVASHFDRSRTYGDPLEASSSYVPPKIDSIQPFERKHTFASITSCDRNIYINYYKGVPIDQYHVSTTLQWTLEKRYSKETYCETKDIAIRDIRSDEQYLSLSIMEEDNYKWRLDLMSKDLIRVRRGLPMDSGEININSFQN